MAPRGFFCKTVLSNRALCTVKVQRPMPIRAVLFDMFDTLVMIEKEHAFYSPAVKSMHTYLTEHGVDVSFSAFRDAYIRERDALYEAADLKMEEPHFNIRVQNTLRSLGFAKEADSGIVQGATDAFCGEFMNYTRVDSEAEISLRQLHSKYRLGLVSNFAIPECVQKLLAENGLADLFEVIVVSGAVNTRKPGPEIFKHALRKLGVEAFEAVFVGDTVDADVLGPKRLGMKTVYINRRPQKDLETACPDQTIKSLGELPAALASL
jgi:putative hydrolase of the HAD superfamily